MLPNIQDLKTKLGKTRHQLKLKKWSEALTERDE